MICVVFVEAEHAGRHWRGGWLEKLRERIDRGDGGDGGDVDDGWDDRTPGGCTHGIPPDVPATLDPRPLARVLAPLLAGTPADGSSPGRSTPSSVVWVDAGDEVVAHLDSLQIRILDGAVIMSLDLEDDASGRAPVVVRFAVSQAGETPGLIVATDEVPGGHPAFAARWGQAVQNAAWAAVLGVVGEHAAAHGQAPAGISAVAGAVRLHLADPVDLMQP